MRLVTRPQQSYRFILLILCRHKWAEVKTIHPIRTCTTHSATHGQLGTNVEAKMTITKSNYFAQDGFMAEKSARHNERAVWLFQRPAPTITDQSAMTGVSRHRIPVRQDGVRGIGWKTVPTNLWTTLRDTDSCVGFLWREEVGVMTGQSAHQLRHRSRQNQQVKGY
jgi:hypothetical protein